MNADTFFTEDGGDSNSRCVNELTKENKDNAQLDPHMKDEKNGGELVCYKCLHGGKLLYCCGKGCQRRYHPYCLNPPLNYIPMGFWHCVWCVKKKLELGVHSISEGVESILDSREVVSENKVMEREYFVKYKGLAHAHNRSILETQMLLEAPKLLAKFKRKHQVIRWKREWSIPHRLLLKRAIVLPKQSDKHLCRHDNNESIGHYEWLVKWTGLGYDHVTWELDDAPFMTSSEGMKLIRDYESRRKRTDRLSNPFEASEERKTSFAELSGLPSGDSPGFYNQHLSYVNKLRMFWHKGQSALIVDDKIDQERVMKVILFISTLHCKVARPFLIISTSTALSAWEMEFLHLVPSANLVVYKGNKDLRSSIRSLEFYSDDGSILFQILLASSDVIVEDLHALQGIPWEAIIIDECQRYRILEHLDNFKILAADMRLLLVSGQIKEDRTDYIKLLSFLKSGQQVSNVAQTGACLSDSISDLKSQLDQYVAFKCNSGSTRFAEYWVPAQLSSLQLEQYCSMLLSNSMLLCSAQKSDALHELISSTRKCCNHPYLLDQSLHNSLNRGLPVKEHLNVGINASGKLHLLEKILLDARSQGLRVVILFQSTGGLVSIGNILDDVLCQRFGKDCYVRYARGYIPSKKQAALDTFNDKESGKFVFLMESRACLPSVKLSSVDIVILFDSDWDPQNDVRALQKMFISSQYEQLTVLRLYSYFTVEEKVLMLAKEGTTLDSNIELIHQSTCHTLLRWGASHLFNKLDDLHNSGTTVSASDISDQSLLSDVMSELSTLLVCGSGDIDHHGLSFIVRAQQKGGEYARDILLFGERVVNKLDNGLNAFSWSNLLEERYPIWKFLSVSSQRIRKTVNHFDFTPKELECENDTIIRKKRKASKDNGDPKGRKVSKDNGGAKKCNVPKDTADAKRREESKDIFDSKYEKKCLTNKRSLKNKKLSTVYNASKMTGNMDDLSKVPVSTVAEINVKSSEQKKLTDMPKSTELLKPELAGLCDVLQLPKNVKAVGMRILEHIFKCYNVNCQEVSTMQAFEISVCWLAASLLKHKIGRRSSLALAKLHLNFDCKEEEVTYVYYTLWEFKKDISSCLRNGFHFEKHMSNCKTPGLKVLVEESPHVSDLVESDTNGHDLQRKSPRTVLSTHDQTCTEDFHIRLMANESCPSRKICGSLPVEEDGVPTDFDAEDDGRNAMTSTPAGASFLEHRNEVPSSSKDPHNVNPTGSLRRQIDGEVSKDSQINVNGVVAGENSKNMSTHPVLLDNVDTNTVTCNTAVPEVSQCVVSPVRGESTTSGIAVTTFPFMQPSNANLQSLPQEDMPPIPSFPESSSVSEALPIDEYFYHISNLHNAEVILQASNDPVEPVNSPFVSPVNRTHVPHIITSPGFMNSGPSQAHSVLSEMPHVALPDPLQIEKKRIEKLTEEASKIREQKLLQLQSDYEKEVEKLGEKYRMLLQNADTAVTQQKQELETYREIVFQNMLLAEVWIQNHDNYKSDAVQSTEQGEMASHSSVRALRSQALKRNADELCALSESQRLDASNSTPSSADLEQPNPKKQKLAVAIKSPDKGKGKSPLGRGSTSSSDVEILDLDAEVGNRASTKKSGKGIALFFDDVPFSEFTDEHLFSEGTCHQITNFVLKNQLQLGQHFLIRDVALLRHCEDISFKLVQVEKERDDLCFELEGEKEHLENIKESMNEYINDNKDLCSRVETAEKELDELKLKFAALQNEKDSLTSFVASLENDKKLLIKEVSDLRVDAKKTLTDWEKSSHEIFDNTLA